MCVGLLAVRTTWIGALLVLFGVFLLWLLFRALIDFAHWFREEIIEDFLERKRNKDRDSKGRS